MTTISHMTRATQHLRIGIVAIVNAFLAYALQIATAAAVPTVTIKEAPGIFIIEFQTNGDSAALEFIALYNSTDEDISFDGPLSPADAQLKLQFFNIQIRHGACTTQ